MFDFMVVLVYRLNLQPTVSATCSGFSASWLILLFKPGNNPVRAMIARRMLQKLEGLHPVVAYSYKSL